MDCKKLIDIGNEAKVYGNYLVSNICCAILTQEYMDRFNNKDCQISIHYETEDPSGEFRQDIYYDLIGFSVGNSYICCPVPIFDAWSAMSLLKTAELKDRHTSSRKLHVLPESSKQILHKLCIFLQNNGIDQNAFEKCLSHLDDISLITIREIWADGNYIGYNIV